jgi:hypothetical protein
MSMIVTDRLARVQLSKAAIISHHVIHKERATGDHNLFSLGSIHILQQSGCA